MNTEQPQVGADPMEPVLILRGSDPCACLLLLMWTCMQEKLGAISSEQMGLAWANAALMEEWARAHGQNMGDTMQAWATILVEAGQRYQTVMADKAISGVVH